MSGEAPARSDSRDFEPPQSLKQLAADTLRAKIFAREIGPGERIDQVALAAELGTSRIPIREALEALVAEGLVELRPRRGAYVVPITKTDILDHYWMLAQISARAAERAALVGSEDFLVQLDSLADAMESATGTKRERLSFDFHALINRVGGSARLRSMLRTLGSPIPLRYYESHSGTHAESNSEHREIIAALRAGDGERAGRATDRHFRKGVSQSLAVLESRGFWD